MQRLDQCVPIHGTVYGLALHAGEGVAGGPAPTAPVLFIKPRNTYLAHGEAVRIPPTLEQVEASAALAMIFGSNTRRVHAADALSKIAGYTLAIDISEAGADFFRPPIREKCRDGFLPVGPSIVPCAKIASIEDLVVRLEIDGAQTAAISLRENIRRIAQSIEDISAFMTFRSGDVLLSAFTPAVSLGVGSRITAVAEGLGRLDCVVAREIVAQEEEAVR